MYADVDNPALAQLAVFAESRRLFWLDPPRGQCEEPVGCPEDNAILYVGDDRIPRCAHHHTRTLSRKPEDGYPCDNCGEGPAFRDPEHRRDEYLCPRCHERYDSYTPSERAMVNKTAKRMGVTHSQGRRAVCIVAGGETACHGEVKQRGRFGQLCSFHADPAGYLRRKGS